MPDRSWTRACSASPSASRRSGAWQCLDAARRSRGPRRRDAEPPRGPLHGVPVGIKDIIDTADMPTEYGSPIYAGTGPARDAACVARLRAAGAS